MQEPGGVLILPRFLACLCESVSRRGGMAFVVRALAFDQAIGQLKNKEGKINKMDNHNNQGFAEDEYIDVLGEMDRSITSEQEEREDTEVFEPLLTVVGGLVPPVFFALTKLEEKMPAKAKKKLKALVDRGQDLVSTAAYHFCSYVLDTYKNELEEVDPDAWYKNGNFDKVAAAAADLFRQFSALLAEFVTYFTSEGISEEDIEETVLSDENADFSMLDIATIAGEYTLLLDVIPALEEVIASGELNRADKMQANALLANAIWHKERLIVAASAGMVLTFAAEMLDDEELPEMADYAEDVLTSIGEEIGIVDDLVDDLHDFIWLDEDDADLDSLDENEEDGAPDDNIIRFKHE